MTSMNSNSLPAPESLSAKVLKPLVVPITAIDPAPAMPVTTTVMQTAMHTEKLSKVEAFALLDELIEKRLQDDFVVGGVLSRIRDRSKHDKVWLEGYPDFKSLVKGRFNYVYRTAAYLINNYLYLVENNIPAETMKGVGWTKIKLLVNEKKLTKGNAATWAKKAKKLSFKKLKAKVSKPTATTPPYNFAAPAGTQNVSAALSPNGTGNETLKPSLKTFRKEMDALRDKLKVAFPTGQTAPMAWLNCFEAGWPEVVVKIEFPA